MKKLVLILAFGLFLSACSSEYKNNMCLNSPSGFASKFNTEDKTLHIKGWDGPFVLYFFSSMCESCGDQIPVINEIREELNGKVKFFGIMSDTCGFDKDKGILKTRDIKFPTTSDPKSVKNLQNIVGGIVGTPTSVIYDKNGKKIAQMIGTQDKDKFMEYLK